MSDNNANNDPIGNSLGVTPVFQKVNYVETLKEKANNLGAQEDFEAARSNIYEAIEAGNEALFELTQLAKASQNARTYEVLAKLIDTLVASNKEMLDLQSKIQDIREHQSPEEKAKTINNNLFVGSTAELQKMLKEIREIPNGN